MEAQKTELTDLLKTFKVMNFKNKLRVTKSLITITSLICIAILGIIFQGCEKEEVFFAEEYLDLDLSKGRDLSSSEIIIYEEARDRIDKYVKRESDKFSLEISSGHDVNISDELFNHFRYTIEQANKMIAQKKIFLTNNGLSFTNKVSIVRLKSGGVEGEYDADGTGLKWWGYSIHITHSQYMTILGGGTIAASWIPQEILSRIIQTILGGGILLYENFGNGNGIIYNITWAGVAWSTYA